MNTETTYTVVSKMSLEELLNHLAAGRYVFAMREDPELGDSLPVIYKQVENCICILDVETGGIETINPDISEESFAWFDKFIIGIYFAEYQQYLFDEDKKRRIEIQVGKIYKTNKDNLVYVFSGEDIPGVRCFMGRFIKDGVCRGFKKNGKPFRTLKRGRHNKEFLVSEWTPEKDNVVEEA